MLTSLLVLDREVIGIFQQIPYKYSEWVIGIGIGMLRVAKCEVCDEKSPLYFATVAKDLKMIALLLSNKRLIDVCQVGGRQRDVGIIYQPAVKILISKPSEDQIYFLDIAAGKRPEILLFAQKTNRKFDLPPFKVNDVSALLVEIGFIMISQLLIGLYTSVNSPVFPGWLSPVTTETFTSSTFIHTMVITGGLSFFWILSRWWSRSLESDVIFFRLKDAFDATWQQWIAVANLYIVSSLVYSAVNHMGVTGIEVPLLSGAAAILLARVLYYGIPI